MITFTEYNKLDKIYKEKAISSIEKILINYELTKEHTDKDNIKTLETKLDLIDKIISNPSKFGVELKYSHDYLDTVNGITDRIDFEYNVENVLRSRKNSISNQIQENKAKQKLDEFKKFSKNIKDQEVQKEVQKLVKEVADSQRKRSHEKEVKLDDIESKIKLYRERTQFISNLLGKESMASLIGSILILIFTISLIVALFKDYKDIPDYIATPFLLVLGYFFGQKTSKT